MTSGDFHDRWAAAVCGRCGLPVNLAGLCPECGRQPTDTETKRCSQFVRRERPYGYTIHCEAPARHEIVAYGPAGERISHGFKCANHAAKSALAYAGRAGWRLSVEEVP